METNSSNNNQAFSWLMKSVTSALTSSSTTSRGGSPNTNNDNDIGGSRNSISSRSSSSNAKIQIESCNDISNLITGMARDFEALLSLAPSTATTSSSLDVVANGNIANDGLGNDHHTNYRPNENLTARLDRVKTLLYEERSSSVISSSLSVADNNDFSWISSRTRPSGGNCCSVAAEVFRCFTKSYTFIDDENGDHGDVASSSDSKDKEIDVDKVQQQELLPKFLLNLPNLPFESRKSISAIFNYLLVCDSRLDHGSGSDASSSTQFASVSSAFGQYVLERANLIIGTLVVYCRRHHHDCGSLQGGAGGRSGKESSSGGGSSSSIGQGHVDIALLCGSMLRSSLRHASIYQWVLKDDNCEQLVYPFLDEYVHDPNFDVSSDALETVRVMLTGLTSPSGGGGGNNDAYYTDDAAADRAYEEYKQQMESIAAEFLDRQYDPIINDRMNKKERAFALISTTCAGTRKSVSIADERIKP